MSYNHAEYATGASLGGNNSVLSNRRGFGAEKEAIRQNTQNSAMDSAMDSAIDSINDTTNDTRQHNGSNTYHNDEIDIEDITRKTSDLKLSLTPEITLSQRMVKIINPIVLTALSAMVRLYRIDAANSVVWDEAHFGKFGSHYLKREFYFDVHPPLGKLLVGFSGYLAGYDGNFEFESGNVFPKNCNFVLMRCFNCMFGILVTPLAYKTALLMGYSQPTVWLITLLVIFEMISLTLSKFILLDSMLLFFTVLCFYCLVHLHHLRIRDKLLTKEGLKWLSTTGFAIGCVCSVKWVGLFVTLLVGFYIIYDLLIKTYQLLSSKHPLSLTKYLYHWATRIVTLILVPFLIYLACFRVHFLVLKNSGPGDGSISTLLQASLNGTSINYGPRTIAFGSLVTLRSQGLSPNLLHSHPHMYPEGSQQQQITTYGFKDGNNEFLVEFDLAAGLRGEFATYEKDDNDTYDYNRPVRNGDTIRLVHKLSDCLLHSHPIPAPILTNHYEVSCYASLSNSDTKDDWVVEIQENEKSPSPDFQDEDADEVHPVSTSFRLRHKVLGCYLATTGYAYPSWGYDQGEVICKKSILGKDKNTWWNVEEHFNDQLPTPATEYVPPAPKFWKEFILLNYGMMASNNALTPDVDKFDKLASEWWQWPILQTGLRMCGWTSDEVKYFLIGNPSVTWTSTFALGGFVVFMLVQAWRWQRQKLNYFGGIFDSDWERLLLQGIVPFLGWLLHYIPFILMGRVTYLHHYVPAQYFAIFVLGFLVESLLYRRCNKYVSLVVYALCYIFIVGSFWYLRPLCFGMKGPSKKFKQLKVLNSWMI